MVTYEVTTIVELRLVEAYERYMRQVHIPDLLSTGCFHGAALTRSAPGRYRVHYEAPSQADLEGYLASHAARLREDFASHFPEGVTVTREAWVAIQRWDAPAGLPAARASAVTKINLAEKFDRFTDQWSPKIVADLNDSHVKLAKVQGAFVWHQHADEDELFIVVRGELTIELRDGQVTLGPGEMVVIPKGIEHRPVAREEVHLMLIEPQAIRHTGDVVSARTINAYARI